MASERPTTIVAGELDALKRALKDRRGGPLPVPYIAVTLEEYCLILALLDEHAKATEWQPIATAPKDGTEILLRGGPENQSWAVWVRKGNWARQRECWSVDMLPPIQYPPTHWLPLPLPPKEA